MLMVFGFAYGQSWAPHLAGWLVSLALAWPLPWAFLSGFPWLAWLLALAFFPWLPSLTTAYGFQSIAPWMCGAERSARCQSLAYQCPQLWLQPDVVHCLLSSQAPLPFSHFHHAPGALSYLVFVFSFIVVFNKTLSRPL